MMKRMRNLTVGVAFVLTACSPSDVTGRSLSETEIEAYHTCADGRYEGYNSSRILVSSSPQGKMVTFAIGDTGNPLTDTNESLTCFTDSSGSRKLNEVHRGG